MGWLTGYLGFWLFGMLAGKLVCLGDSAVADFDSINVIQRAFKFANSTAAAVVSYSFCKYDEVALCLGGPTNLCTAW